MLRKKLNDERARNVARGEAIVAAAEARAAADAEDKGFTTEELAELGTLKGRRTEIDAQLTALDADRDGGAHPAAGRDSAGPVPGVRVITDAADQPWGPKIPDGASKAVRNRLVSLGLGNMLQAVAKVSMLGIVDPRLRAAPMPGGDSAAASGQNTGTPSDGGFLVRTDYSTFLLDRGREEAQLAPLCDNVPIGADADGLEAPIIDETSRATGSRWGGVQVYRRQETDTVTATKVKFAAWDLRLEDLMALSYASERSLRDASSLGAIMATAFASEFAFVIDDEILRGDGNGKCQGILVANALVSVAKETNQPAATVLSTNLSKMWARVPSRNRANAIWFVNQEVEPQLDEMTIPAGTAALDSKIVTYSPGDGLMRIKGRPIKVVEQMSAVGTQGDIMVADLSQYALITKDGIDAQESIHVRFLYNERAFRWVYRINGQSKWQAALTPYKGTGSNKLSPFVVLDTRA